MTKIILLKKLLIVLIIVGCEQIIESEILTGGTIPGACNYIPGATTDNNSCVMPQGCNDWCTGDSLYIQEMDICGVCNGDGATCN